MAMRRRPRMSLVTLRMQRVGTCETQPNMITAANALPRRPASNSSITHVIDTSRMGGRNILRLAGLPNEQDSNESDSFPVSPVSSWMTSSFIRDFALHIRRHTWLDNERNCCAPVEFTPLDNLCWGARLSQWHRACQHERGPVGQRLCEPALA